MAASKTIRRIHRIDDQTLIETLQRVIDLFPDQDPQSVVFVAAGVSIPFQEVDASPNLTGRYVYSGAQITARFPDGASLALSFHRSITQNTDRGAERVPSANYDEFELVLGPNGANWADKSDLISSVLEVISELDISENTGPSVGDGEAGTLRELILGFGSTHRQMLASLDDAIKAVEAKRLITEEELAKRDKERADAHAAALEELDEERKKLLLQSHMSERRELLKTMTDQTASNVRKSMAPRGAVMARWGVFFASLLLAMISAILAYSSIAQLQAVDASIVDLVASLPEGADAAEVTAMIEASYRPANWYLIARSILSSLVALGAIVYATTWMRGFYNGEISAAREIDRYNYDLTRASWVIETILEVQHEQKGEVPDAWIEGVTRGLFAGTGGQNTEDDGAQALRALLGYTAAASFGPEGPKFEISRRQARKLAKDGAIQE